MPEFIIGIDGGGTKTAAVLMDKSGIIQAHIVGKSSNFQVTGKETFQQTIQNVVHSLLKKSNMSTQNVDHLYMGLSGAGRFSDRQAIHSIISPLGLAQKITVDTDAAAAIAGAFAGEPGIILISGTGSICFGKSRNGTLYRAGGWGYLLGDEGSGYYIGQQAIMAALKNYDGQGQDTSLLKVIEHKFNLDHIDLIIPPIYSGKIDRSEISGLAPLVFRESANGDKIAQNIIETAGKELGNLIAAIIKQMGLHHQKVTVALVGSIFNQKEILIPHIKISTIHDLNKINFIEPLFEPVIGACILALQAENITICNNVLKNIQQSMSHIFN